MKRSILLILISGLASINVNAQLAQQTTKAYNEQWENITATIIKYDEENIVPPLVLKGEELVKERKSMLEQQEKMIEQARQSKDYSSEEEAKVIKSIEKLRSGIENPRVFIEERTYITNSEMRCKKRNRFNPDTYISESVCNRLTSFAVIYHPIQKVLKNPNRDSWFIPIFGLCRFGADIGWWLNNGFSLSDLEDNKLALLDPKGELLAILTIDPSLNYAWTSLSILNGSKIIECENFEMINGLPVPQTVIVKEKLSDGTYYQISKKVLIEAKVNTDIDNSVFEIPNDIEVSILNR